MSAPLNVAKGPPEGDPRLSTTHARRRLEAEDRHEARVRRGGIDFVHVENSYSVHSAIRGLLRMTGLYRRGQRNAEQIVVRVNNVRSASLPPRFDGFTMLQISDLHAELHRGATQRLIAMVGELDYDLVALTGDYRARTYGPIEESLDAVAALRAQLRGQVFGVLGNHDSITMLPRLEAMGVRLLVNESTPIVRDGERIYLAGVDDNNYFDAADVERARAAIPQGAFSVLLSHTPEIYRSAAGAGFNLLLAGHTHGGQICLPRGVPLTLASSGLPRRYGSGPWRYGTMDGYTSTGVGCSGVDVRFNCPPEITLHRLRRSA